MSCQVASDWAAQEPPRTLGSVAGGMGQKEESLRQPRCHRTSRRKRWDPPQPVPSDRSVNNAWCQCTGYGALCQKGHWVSESGNSAFRLSEAGTGSGHRAGWRAGQALPLSRHGARERRGLGIERLDVSEADAAPGAVWPPCALCLTLLVFLTGAQSQSTVTPGESRAPLLRMSLHYDGATALGGRLPGAPDIGPRSLRMKAVLPH